MCIHAPLCAVLSHWSLALLRELVAFSNNHIQVITDTKSPSLGALTIELQHQSRAMLSLPESAVTIDVDGTYIMNSNQGYNVEYKVTGLETLWALMNTETDNEEYSSHYYPLTKVGNNWQTIVVLDETPRLIGFKAVLTTEASGAVGQEGFDAKKTFMLDLPLSANGSSSITLAENTLYPLTLSISPNNAAVTLTVPNGKPGWGTEENELSNAENEKRLELSYNSSTKTFSVSGPFGLQSLNKWMTGSMTTTDFQAIGFAGAEDITAEAGSSNALWLNITFTKDIELLAPATAGESNWIPIGTQAYGYSATIDGGGHTLTGMVINTTKTYQGFGGCLSNRGLIKNLTFKDAQVTSTRETIGIVAANSNGKVENCHTIGTSSVNGTYNVGGIVGANGSGTITNCTNAAQVASSDNDNRVGGIVSSCINSGAVSGNSDVTDTDIDGVGTSSGTITSCYSAAAISDWSSVVGAMNGAISTWNTTSGNESKQVNYHWTVGTETNATPVLTSGAPTAASGSGSGN